MLNQSLAGLEFWWRVATRTVEMKGKIPTVMFSSLYLPVRCIIQLQGIRNETNGMERDPPCKDGAHSHRQAIRQKMQS